MSERFNLRDILSARHIQQTGRELWQDCYDTNSLDTLDDLVCGEIAKELYVLMWPERDIPDTIDEVPSDLQDLIVTMVAESLDVEELSREARENTDDIYDINIARQGRY